MKTKITFLAVIFSLSFSTIFLTKCKKDKCKNTVCQNGGTCNDGTCACATGYTGTHCETQKTPTNITVTKITVTNFNVNGDPDENYPDIYVKLLEGSTVLYNAPTYYTDVTSSAGSWSWSVILNLNPSKTYTLELWDYDTITDDWLQGATFSLYSSSGGFPSSKSYTTGSFAFTIDMSYSF